MPEISTGYKPNYALGALYQGFNAADADESSLQSIMHQFLQNQREQQQEPLDRLIKMWQARESLGKLQDPEYLKSMLEGYKGQMNSQVAAGRKAKETVEGEIPVINQDNKNKLFMGKTLEDWNNLRMSQQPQEQQGSIGIPMQSPDRIPEQWGGEGLQNGSKVSWSGPNPPKDIKQWTDWGGNQLGNIGKQSDMIKSFGIDRAPQPSLLSNFVKPQEQTSTGDIEKLQNILVNTPEHLQRKDLVETRGDYALEGISLRNRAMLEAAGKKMTGSNKPLKLDEGIQIATAIVAGQAPGDIESAKRYLAIVADTKVQSNPVSYTQAPLNLPATVQAGTPVTTVTPAQQSAEKVRGLLGGGEVRQYDQNTGKQIVSGTTKSGTKFTITPQ